VLGGLAAIGLDAAAIAASAGYAPADEELVPAATWGAIWRAARAASGDPALPSRVGAAIPVGKLGLLDYLVASAQTVDGALRSLADHMSAAASMVGLHYDPPRARVVSQSTARADTDEFVVGMLVARMRRLVDGADPVARVALNRPRPEDARPHESFYAVTIEWDAPRAGIDLVPETLNARLETTDPDLHRVLRETASRLGLGPGISELETRIRARLPGLIARGRADAQTLARSLGMSRRTLYRRLDEAGQSLQAILDAYRADQAERMLRAGAELIEVAHATGYADQAAFTRAFVRWRGMSPGKWRATVAEDDT